ncbi:MAG: hypothetical protein ACTHJJ_15400 [Intrasporangium sp.]|uniref:hypothetical protein n=1 Tax=Intrasporangium sp. TaxID=1925024 RepID=UPI003F7E18EC
MGGSDNLPVGPGIAGFIAVFLLALALWFLLRNMNARLRRMAYRERDRVEHERQEHQKQAQPDGFTSGEGRDAPTEPHSPINGPVDGSSPDGRGPAPRA